MHQHDNNRPLVKYPVREYRGRAAARSVRANQVTTTNTQATCFTQKLVGNHTAPVARVLYTQYAKLSHA